MEEETRPSLSLFLSLRCYYQGQAESHLSATEAGGWPWLCPQVTLSEYQQEEEGERREKKMMNPFSQGRF